VGALQKAADFIKAIVLGFSVGDALALLRMDDLYIDSFIVEDVKYLKVILVVVSDNFCFECKCV
jgi:RNA-binding protein PNO1